MTTPKHPARLLYVIFLIQFLLCLDRVGWKYGRPSSSHLVPRHDRRYRDYARAREEMERRARSPEHRAQWDEVIKRLHQLRREILARTGGKGFSEEDL
jgi:hypothetical protein